MSRTRRPCPLRSRHTHTFHIAPSACALRERRNPGSRVRRSVSVCSPRSRHPALSGGCPWPFSHPFSKASFALSLNLIKYLCAQAKGVRKRVCFTYAILKSGSLYYMGQGKATLTPDMYHSESSPPLGTNLIWEFELEFAFNKTPRRSDLEQSSVSRLRHLRKPPNMVPRTTNVPVSQAHTTPHLEKYL